MQLVPVPRGTHLRARLGLERVHEAQPLARGLERRLGTPPQRQVTRLAVATQRLAVTVEHARRRRRAPREANILARRQWRCGSTVAAGEVVVLRLERGAQLVVGDGHGLGLGLAQGGVEALLETASSLETPSLLCLALGGGIGRRRQ